MLLLRLQREKFRKGLLVWVGDSMGVHLYTNGAWTDSGRIYRNSLNLYDINNVNFYNAYLTSTIWLLADDSRSIRIPVEGNTTYTLSVSEALAIFRISASSNPNLEPTAVGVSAREIIRSANINTYTFTTNPNDSIIIFQGSFSTFETWKNLIMLTTGSAFLPYEPYNVVDWYTNTGYDYSSGAWD